MKTEKGINFEGIEAGYSDPEGALNLHLRVARDHSVLNVWPVRGEMAHLSGSLAQILGPPKSTPRSAAGAESPCPPPTTLTSKNPLPPPGPVPGPFCTPPGLKPGPG